MSASYLNFDLLIDRGPTGYRARVIASPAGEAMTDFALPFGGDELASFLERYFDGDFSQPGLDARAFGLRLYQAVFAGAVGRCLRRSLDEAGRSSAGLRIRLRFDAGAPELAELPWELLYAPDLERLLAPSSETPLVRYLPVEHSSRMQPVRPPLVVLAALSNPAGATPLAVEREWQHLQEAVAGLDEGHVRLERAPATWAALQARLRQGPVHVLHFVGHGFFDRGQNLSGLVFEDDAGRASIVPAEMFKTLLHDHDALRLVYLNACEGASNGRSDPFSGVAQQLVQQGVPAVVAMQFPVSDAAAVTLSREFYRALAGGYPVDAALSEARKAVLGQTGSPEWATPVLFSRSDDNRLIDLPLTKNGSMRQASLQALVPPPPEPARPPDISGFVGREKELALYGEALRSAHFAVIAGMPGVGKTALAAKLASQVSSDPDHIFWHQFHEGEHIEAIIWRLAGLLARNGQGELWQMLQIAAQSGGKPPPIQVLLDYLFQLVRGRDYVICLDDFHHVEDDPLIEVFLERLQDLLPAGQVTILLTSREVPAFIKSVRFDPLQGLDRASVEHLLRARKVNLPSVLAAELWQRTAGNAELVNLAVEALRKATHPERVIERLIDEDDVEGFLLREVDEHLHAEEKSVMNGVAVLMGHPGTRDAIEATLDASGIRRTLHYLSNRYLLMELEGRHDREYTQHAILQAFYYDLLGRRERQEMHRRAGEYYEKDEPDRLRAALHYHRTAEHRHAAELATADIWAAVNQGQAHPLRLLLEALKQSALDSEMQLRVLVALGDLLAFLGSGEAAQAHYREALRLAAQAHFTPEPGNWEARACLGMGTALEHQAPEEALRWLVQGLAAIGDDDTELRAALYNRIGSVRIGLAEYEDAIASLQQALSLLPATSSQQRANILINLGTGYASAGDTDLASRYTAQALDLSRQLHDLYGVLGTLSNIGIDKEIGGDWAGAGAAYQEALQLAEQLGSLAEQARIHSLLGTLRLNQGHHAAAGDHLRRAVGICQQIGNREYLAGTLCVLARLHMEQQEWNPAHATLAEAETLATEHGWDYILPETYTTQALLALVEGDLIAAQERIQSAIDVATELGQTIDEGKAWRVRGMALAAAGQTSEALASFERSLALLAGQDPYETAQTQLACAHVLTAAGDVNQAALLRHEAEATLLSLGATVQR